MPLKRKAVSTPAIRPSASDLGLPSSPSSSSSKRVRIQEPSSSSIRDVTESAQTIQEGTDTETDIAGDLDLEEKARKRAQPGRSGRVVTTGYDSDDDQEEEEQQNGKDQDQDEDMFDLDDDKEKEEKKEKIKDDEEDQGGRILELSEIEGQEFGQVTRIPGDELEAEILQQEGEEEEIDPELELEDEDDEEEEDEFGDDENARGERTPTPEGESSSKKSKTKRKKGMGFKLDSFNMKSEYQLGRFDEEGNYLTKGKDPEADADNWLKGNYSRKGILKTKEANEKRKKEEENKRLELDKSVGNELECKKKLLEFMKKGENVLESLRRIGDEKKEILKERKELEKKKKGYGKKKAEAIMKDGDETNENRNDKGKGKEIVSIKDLPITKALEEITTLSSALMERFGKLNIYEETFEGLLREVRRSGIVSQDWVPSSSSSTFTSTSTSTSSNTISNPTLNSNLSSSASSSTPNQDTQMENPEITTATYQYRWSPSYLSQIATSEQKSVSPEMEIFGPFAERELRSWAESGFFGQEKERILLRKNQDERWRSWEDVLG